MPSPLNLVGRQVLVTTSDGDYTGTLRTVTIQTISRTLRGRILSHGPNSIRLQVPEHTITISRDQIVHITR